MRTIFLGTPALAVPFLERLHQKTEVAAVITSPDQPAGRGYELKAPEVKIAAQKLSLPVLQPETLKNPAVVDQIRALRRRDRDCRRLWKAPAEGCSVDSETWIPECPLFASAEVPRRSANPVDFDQRERKSGDSRSSGWTKGWTRGRSFCKTNSRSQPEDDAESLRNKLVNLGVICIEEALGFIGEERLNASRRAARPAKPPFSKKEDGQIDWKKPAEMIWNQLRGMTPWPGTYTGHLKILKAHPVLESTAGEPGTVVRVVSGEGPIVKCGEHVLALLEVQPEGKKSMSAWSWWQGARLKIGDKIR